MIRLWYHPFDSKSNEYLSLFYKALAPYGVYAQDGLMLWNAELKRRAPELDAIHIQWCPEDLWRLHTRGTAGQLKNLARLWRFLRIARRHGLRILWTVHDIEHHEGSGPLDQQGYRLIARASDLVICHNEAARAEVLHRFRIDPARTLVMPIGNYDGVLPPPGPRERTLADLGLSTDRRTLVTFGAARHYKGMDLAIDAARRLRDAYQLIVVGRPQPADYGAYLQERAKDLPGARLCLEHVDDQRLADLVHAADCVLLPYRKITGSSAVLHAFSLGRGVVAADLPFFREMIANDPESGELCRPEDVADLARAIDAFFHVPVERRHAAARRVADLYAWDRVIRPVGDWFVRRFPGKCDHSEVPA
jgi:glycosyltransferase involved in cell wall biosynthesis